ncbi:sensor histidine kinase [Thermoactinospora rubra]|uniref:sensor histidine kinase n=1 Tax=Thermoactinospora rubra TaxID=1088767 RepID=UPI000A0FC4EA|nr:histidine kinase [Thermoactinospora rubra]
MTSRRVRIPPRGVDALVGAGVTLAVSVVISAGQGGRQHPDALAYVWAAGLGALMLIRRHHPRTVLALSALGLFAYYAAGYPAVGLAVPVAAALFSAAEAGRLRAAVVTALTVVGFSLLFRLLEGQDAAFVVGYDLIPHLALMAAAVALGDGVRSRRSQQAQQRQIAELTARQYAQEAERRVHAERLAIARDLHDSIGHTVSVISLHADVAREALSRDQAAVADALGLIRDAATRTMRELRRTVALLRTPGEPPRSSASLSNLESLADTARAAGIAVETAVSVPGRLPDTVDAAAYRIAQEAVTNVVRHSAATRLSITGRVEGGALHLCVADDGTAVPAAVPMGHGIAGMSERARSLGGTLTARREEGGFVVRAELPLEGPS